MKRYIRLNDYMTKPTDLEYFPSLFAEIGDDGWVSREVGLDDRGRVVYKFPNLDFPQFRGTCDMAKFAVPDGDDALDEAGFEKLWSAPSDPEELGNSIRTVMGPSLWLRLLEKFR
jgi:hypothetical protein